MPPALAGNPVTDTPGRHKHRRRLAGLLRAAPTAGASHHDPLFQRPDLVDDDYYRFRRQPRGW